MLLSLEYAGGRQLGLMRPHQLRDVVCGMAQLGHLPGPHWQASFFAAAQAAAPSLEPSHMADMMQVSAAKAALPLLGGLGGSRGR